MKEIHTAGHGGFKLDRKRNALVNEAWRKAGGWYEEDIDWAIVAVTLGSDAGFSSVDVASAHKTLRDWRPDAYEAVFGCKPTLEESHVLRARAFAAEHANDYVTVCAYGSWHTKVPPGFVGVECVRGGRLANGQYASNDKKVFLVPETEYSLKSSPFGFVADPARHTELSDLK